VVRSPALAVYLHTAHRQAVASFSRARAGCLPLLSTVTRWLRLPAADKQAASCCWMCDSGAEENLRHLLLQCPATAGERFKLCAMFRERLARHLPWRAIDLLVDTFNDDGEEAVNIALGAMPPACLDQIVGSDDRARARRRRVERVFSEVVMRFVHACWRHRVRVCGKTSVAAGRFKWCSPA
jgi:hypothetical protein